MDSASFEQGDTSLRCSVDSDHSKCPVLDTKDNQDHQDILRSFVVNEDLQPVSASKYAITTCPFETASVDLSPQEIASMNITLDPMSHDLLNEMQTNILWNGVIFESIQMLRHFKDSKSFTDHVLKTNPYEICQSFSSQMLNYCQMPKINNLEKCESSQSFSNLRQNPKSDCSIKKVSLRSSRASYHNGFVSQYQSKLDEFMKSYFFNPGFGILAGQTPIDWNECPRSVLFEKTLSGEDTKAQKLRRFAMELNNLWKILYREVNQNVSAQPFRYSFIALKHPQIFVPGGRFREVYYWDSLWIIQGLLSCKMVDSAIKLVENMTDLVLRYGFVPNGTRKYYLDRSQPPLLSLMVMEIFTTTNDTEWLQSIAPALSKEYKYWTTDPVQVSVPSKRQKNKKLKLARYWSSSKLPRSESYHEVCLI